MPDGWWGWWPQPNVLCQPTAPVRSSGTQALVLVSLPNSPVGCLVRHSPGIEEETGCAAAGVVVALTSDHPRASLGYVPAAQAH